MFGTKNKPSSERPEAPSQGEKPSMTQRPLRGMQPLLPQMREIKEKQRVYHYPNGTKLVLNNVTGLGIRDSGNHRLTADGKLWIVAPGWIAIEIDESEWTL